MKFGQLIKYNKIKIFLQNHSENEVGGLVPDPSLFLKKSLHKVKTNGLQLHFNIFQ